MGIDIHNLNLLAHAQDLGASFDRCIAIGRQALFIEDRVLDEHRRLRRQPPLLMPPVSAGAPVYFEPLMQQWFGSSEVASVDASAYENATHIHDMNLPWPMADAARGRFDAVLDFGCLEHVFDFPTAWRNCVALCRVGGHVLHALPANNLCGHGFYQFSPELFFNLYRPQRGFELLGLFFALRAERGHWWRVASPLALRRRVNLCNGHEVYMLVLARKTAELPPGPAPQQSDYAGVEWLGAGAPPAAVASRAAPVLASLGLLDGARSWRERWRVLRGNRLDLPPPDYQRVDVAPLLARRT